LRRRGERGWHAIANLAFR